MQFCMVAGWLTAFFVSVQRRWSEAGQREDPQGAPDDGALRPGPPGSSGSTQDTRVHVNHTFSSYQYIFAYRLYLLYICFTVDDFILINLKKKKPLMKPKWTHMWQMLQMWPVLPAWLVCHLIKCLCDLLLESCLRLTQQRSIVFQTPTVGGEGGGSLICTHTPTHSCVTSQFVENVNKDSP